jgi:hypothetical protein
MNRDDCGFAIRNASLRAIGNAFGVCVCLLAFATSAVPVEKQNLEAFAKCLASKKVSMFGSFYCSHCDDQKQLFGNSFQYVPYVECSIPGSRELTFSCKLAQIRHTPTWILGNGERLIGVQPLQTLSEKTGCPLP